MLTSTQFIVQNETIIQKEIDEMIETISSNLESGFFRRELSLCYAPIGAASFVAFKVQQRLASSGWHCEINLDENCRQIEFIVSPDLSRLV